MSIVYDDIQAVTRLLQEKEKVRQTCPVGDGVVNREIRF